MDALLFGKEYPAGHLLNFPEKLTLGLDFFFSKTKQRDLKVLCIHFNDLTIMQLYQIMALRQEVFVVEQNCPYLDADGKDLDAWHLMLLNEEDTLIAYTRLLPKGVSYENYPSIGRVVSSPSVRGSGIGKALMELSIEHMENLFGKIPIKIGAQCYLEKFYKSLGFEPQGEVYLEDGIPHMAMIRTPK